MSSDRGTIHIFGLRVRVLGDDYSALLSPQSPGLGNQNSSSSTDALIPTSTGANPGSSLSFMRGKLITFLIQKREYLHPKHLLVPYINSCRCFTQVFQLRMVIRAAPFTRGHPIHCCIWISEHNYNHWLGWKVCNRFPVIKYVNKIF